MANNIRNLVAAGPSYLVYPSAARTATPDTEELELPRGTRYMSFILTSTAASATPSVVMKVEGVDRQTSTVWTILEGLAVTGAGLTSRLHAGPGITVSGTLFVATHIPPVVRVTCTHADADSLTYSVGAYFT